jgi:putative ABC transport system permease protein
MREGRGPLASKAAPSVIRLARRHLFEDLPRLFASLGGIVFAVTLVMVQTGIYNGFVRSTSLLVENSRADIWLAAREMLYLEVTLPIPHKWLDTARSVEGVARTEPLVLRSVVWQSSKGELAYVRVIGFDPEGTLLRVGGAPGYDLRAVSRAAAFAADEGQLKMLGVSGIGASGKIRDRDAHLVTLTRDTQPNISPTFFYTSIRNAANWSPVTMRELVHDPFAPTTDAESPLNFVLIEVKPGADVAAVRTALERALPKSRALTHQEMMDATRAFWIKRTNFGFLLSLGALLGLLVGSVVVAQILYTSVNEHLREYGTLKALGISDASIYASLIWQGVAMAVLGYFPALLLSLAVGWYARTSRGVGIEITPAGALFVFGLAVAMCVGAALIAVQRATRVDPATVFKG